MKVNKTYRSLLDKSIASMLSAIEIYNKPNFGYREETFAILSVNAWELLLKAYILKINKYNLNNIYILEPILKKNGEKSNRKRPALNKVGNPKTISISEALSRLSNQKLISLNLYQSIDAIIELRDNAVHFVNEKVLVKEIQELGFACIKNYISVIKKWELDIDLSSYNFYLMPLAYIDSKVFSDAIIPNESKKYIDFILSKLKDKDSVDDEFDIAISIDINFNKSNSFDGLGFNYDKDGLKINLSEEDIRLRFPLTHGAIIKKAKLRYLDFKADTKFLSLLKTIKMNSNLHYLRKLDPKNLKENGRPFYSSNIWQELDKHYKRIVSTMN